MYNSFNKISFLLLFVSITLIILISGCNNKPKPIMINPDLLKYDWEAEKDRNNIINSLNIEDDSLLYQTLTFASGGYDLIAPYKIYYDTLFITSDRNLDHHKIGLTTFKYKIIKVDSLKLILKEIFPNSERDTVVFNKQIRIKKNDLKIERIDFFSGFSLGIRPPIQSLSIGADSVMYHYGYCNTKHNGLSKHKLSPVEFARIQNRLNYIDRNNFVLGTDIRYESHLRLYIKTSNDSIETRGSFSYIYDELDSFIIYLTYKERYMNLIPINDEEFSFRYDRFGGLN